MNSDLDSRTRTRSITLHPSNFNYEQQPRWASLNKACVSTRHDARSCYARIEAHNLLMLIDNRLAYCGREGPSA